MLAWDAPIWAFRPFLVGWRPVGTIVRGRTVMWDGEIIGPAQGEPVGFLEGFAR